MVVDARADPALRRNQPTAPVAATATAAPPASAPRRLTPESRCWRLTSCGLPATIAFTAASTDRNRSSSARDFQPLRDIACVSPKPSGNRTLSMRTGRYTPRSIARDASSSHEPAFGRGRALAPHHKHAFRRVQLLLDRAPPFVAAADLGIPPDGQAMRFQRCDERLHTPAVFSLVRDENVGHSQPPDTGLNMVNDRVDDACPQSRNGQAGMPAQWTAPSSTAASR